MGAVIPLVVQRAGGVWVQPVTVVPPTGACESDGNPIAKNC